MYMIQVIKCNAVAQQKAGDDLMSTSIQPYESKGLSFIMINHVENSEISFALGPVWCMMDLCPTLI